MRTGVRFVPAPRPPLNSLSSRARAVPIAKITPFPRSGRCARCNGLPNIDSAPYSAIIRYLFVAGPARLKVEDSTMRLVRSAVLAAIALALAAHAGPASAAPEGRLTWGVHISLAPTFFDPAETPGLITPFMILYALHDAMVKPMPGQGFAPSLAESWSQSKD